MKKNKNITNVLIVSLIIVGSTMSVTNANYNGKKISFNGQGINHNLKNNNSKNIINSMSLKERQEFFYNKSHEFQNYK